MLRSWGLIMQHASNGCAERVWQGMQLSGPGGMASHLAESGDGSTCQCGCRRPAVCASAAGRSHAATIRQN